MNKADFVSHIATKFNCTKAEATEVIDIFTDSVTSVLGSGDTVSLVGFGNFSVSHIGPRTGRNPRTGEAMQIKAYKQPKFKAGQKLKDACK